MPPPSRPPPCFVDAYDMKKDMEYGGVADGWRGCWCGAVWKAAAVGRCCVWYSWLPPSGGRIDSQGGRCPEPVAAAPLGRAPKDPWLRWWKKWKIPQFLQKKTLESTSKNKKKSILGGISGNSGVFGGIHGVFSVYSLLIHCFYWFPLVFIDFDWFLSFYWFLFVSICFYLFLFVFICLFYLFLFIFLYFYWFLLILKHSWIQMKNSDFFNK